MNIDLVDGKNYWTKKNLAWLRSLQLKGITQEALDEYLVSYDYFINKLEHLDKRIEEIATDSRYQDKVKKLSCLIVRTHTALSYR